MPVSFRQSKQASPKSIRRSAVQAEQSPEDEALPDVRSVLNSTRPISKDVLHRTILQLQRTVGNKATQTMVQQKSSPSAVQRKIEKGGDHKPVLAALFNDAVRVVRQLLEQNYLGKYQNTLPANSPLKTASFDTVWADAGGRAAITEAARLGFVSENPNFLSAVDAYKAAPTPEKAIEIIDTYIKESAAQEINIDAIMRADYAAARESLDTPPPPPVDLQVEDDANFDPAPATRTRS